MPKKNMTPEDRAAWGEKMKAARAAKAQELAQELIDAQESVELADEGLKESLPPQPTPEPDEASGDDLAQLKQLVQQLSSEINTLKGAPTQTPTVGARGVVGTYEKFSVRPDYYPNPINRLFDYMESTPALRRFGFRDNYELSWNVTPTRYQTIDGVWTSEPRFTVELIGVIYDENTYEKTDRRYIVRKLTFHEDPDAAISVAQQYDLPIDEQNPRQFLDEMRYLRVRQWLHDTFFPEKFLPDRSDTKDIVIGNKLVTMFTVNSKDAVDPLKKD